jgi:hypothetical protein
LQASRKNRGLSDVEGFPCPDCGQKLKVRGIGPAGRSSVPGAVNLFLSRTAKHSTHSPRPRSGAYAVTIWERLRKRPATGPRLLQVGAFSPAPIGLEMEFQACPVGRDGGPGALSPRRAAVISLTAPDPAGHNPGTINQDFGASLSSTSAADDC